jgi:hypothetical protein
MQDTYAHNFSVHINFMHVVNNTTFLHQQLQHS